MDRPQPASRPAATISGISSMATRELLSELLAGYAPHGGEVRLESVGGIEAARRVQAGEAFDFVVLASDAIDKLIAGGHVVAGSKADLVHSGVAVAVRAGAPRPEIDDEAALQRAVLRAASIGLSTGPSGVQLQKLFERWGMADRIAGRCVQASPGVAVGTLVACGEVELGFQQLSELMHLDGIDVVGPLPAAIQIVTTFSAGLCSASANAGAVRQLFDYLCSPGSAEAKRRNGMDPA